MSARSCIRGEPEIVFSFAEQEIVFEVEQSIVSGWKITPYQTHCKV